MFVDDSIWLTDSAAAAQEMARRCELFCDFHSVIINREKSEYLSMNDQGHTLRWTPTNTHPLGKEMHRTGTHGATKRNRGPDGRTIKYLGVHFDAGAGWATQRRKLQEKHGELTAALKHATITVREATYCINNKIIPSIAYPLQVAAVPRSVLERWDKTHRAILRRVGKLPMHMPPAVFHLPTELGGLGLKSMIDVVTELRIKMELAAKNDCWITPEGGECTSTHAAVVRAAAVHAERYNSIGWHANKELKRVRAECRRTPAHLALQHIAESDRSGPRPCILDLANHTPGPFHIYTDGGTIPGEHPISGWGFTINNDEGKTLEDNDGTKWEGAGRLQGEQNNTIAEAMALLQSIRTIPLSRDCHIYIDNTGVLCCVNKDLWDDPRQRLDLTGRAVWNRIHCLLHERKSAGALTRFHWIHSHVDDADRRQWKETSRFTCACGGE
jgi:hypothetical protein